MFVKTVLTVTFFGGTVAGAKWFTVDLPDGLPIAPNDLQKAYHTMPGARGFIIEDGHMNGKYIMVVHALGKDYAVGSVRKHMPEGQEVLTIDVFYKVVHDPTNAKKFKRLTAPEQAYIGFSKPTWVTRWIWGFDELTPTNKKSSWWPPFSTDSSEEAPNENLSDEEVKKQLSNVLKFVFPEPSKEAPKK